MTEDNHQNRGTPDTSSSTSEMQTSAPKKRLEDLLIDDAPQTTFRALADQEVKSGNRVGGLLGWPLVVLALLVVAVVGVVVGWYQFGDLLSSQFGIQPQVRVEKRMVAPERPQPLENSNPASSGAASGEVIEKQDAAAPAEQITTEVTSEMVTDRVIEETVEEQVEEVEEVVANLAVVPEAVVNDAVDTGLTVEEGVVNEVQQRLEAEIPVAAVAEPAHRVLVGPFVNQRDLERAAALLRERGFNPQQELGSGTVDMIRLLEGIYPLAQARLRLEEIRSDYSSAFLLPDGDRWALYIGSFSDRERARRQQRELAERQIQVAQVDSQLTIEGPMLVVVRGGLKAAEEVAAEVNASGLRARIEVER
jgi:hypothetical protein